jgi:poly(3-hydroxybutyrate) depolymerase
VRTRERRRVPDAGALVAIVALVLMRTGAAAQSTVEIPWRPGNAERFQAGATEERQAQAAQGTLPVTVFRPDGEDDVPFVVLLHGCGGLRYEAMWSRWVQSWAELLITSSR